MDAIPYSARQVAEILDLPHLEVIRRIRRGDIKAAKMGWNWAITEDAVKDARNSDWYKRRLARQQREQFQTSLS